jgi:hypothetical protein
VRRRERCSAVYQTNEELHACRRRSGHLGRHVARFWITALTDTGRPLWESRVALRWTEWRSIRREE